MDFLKNKNGFSLIEIVIAMGLATGLLLFLMKMQAQQVKTQKTAKANAEIESFVSDFKGVLNRPGFCNKSFLNLPLNDNTYTPVTAVLSPRGEARYKVGEVYGDRSIKLKALTIKNFKADDAEGLEGIAQLEISIERMGKIFGSKFISRQIDISIARDKSNKIVSCGTVGGSGAEKTAIVIITDEKGKEVEKKIDLTNPEQKLNTPEAKQIIESTPQLKEAHETLKSLQQMQEKMKQQGADGGESIIEEDF